MKRVVALALFLILVVGGGLAIGYLTLPGPWYAHLTKAEFNPPNWVFGPVWTLLYVMIAIAGWRVWMRGGGAAMTVWWVALALNFAWSPVFFAAHQIEAALAIIGLLLLAVVVFIALAWRKDRAAAWLFVPYGLWVAFATALNAAIAMLN